jgi:DNA-3-methyladenine glycosylase
MHPRCDPSARPVKNIDGQLRGRLLAGRAHDRRLNSHDLVSDDFYAATRGAAPPALVSGPRIGVDYAGRWARRLLCFIKGNPFVSNRSVAGREALSSATPTSHDPVFLR